MLPEYLAEAARTPLVWGETDCAFLIANWVLLKRGVDPARDFRGRYRTELGAARLIHRHGGMKPFFASLAANAGLSEATEPSAGCVGLVRAITDKGEALVGGICTGSRWAVRRRSSLTAGPATPVIIWTV